MKHKYLLAYMDMAERFAETSCATRLKVGSLLVRGDNILSVGVNGTPVGWPTNECEDAEGNTLDIVNHSEINLLNKMRKSSESTLGATLFVTAMPCLKCAIQVVDAGIKSVYYRHEYRCKKGIEYLESHGIEINRI